VVGELLTIVVGGGGFSQFYQSSLTTGAIWYNLPGGYGGGGNANTNNINWQFGAGGGRSAVVRGVNDLITAGGGGGGGSCVNKPCYFAAAGGGGGLVGKGYAPGTQTGVSTNGKSHIHLNNNHNSIRRRRENNG